MVLDIDATLRLLINNANCFSFYQNSYFFVATIKPVLYEKRKKSL